jgi:hypothetical protein
VLTDERSGLRLGDVDEVEELLGAVVGRLDPDAVPLFDTPEFFAAFDRVVRLGESAKTLLARRVEQASTWHSAGFRSAAEQLAAVSGTSVASARSLLETSKQVEALPATADALRAGVLSAAKARVIAAAAAVAPEAEAALLESAETMPLAQLREKCLVARAGVDRDAAHERIRRERHAREYPDAEGAWNLRARGTPEKGAEFRFAFDPIVEEMFKAARAEGRSESREAYAFDALIEMARRASGSSVADQPKGGASPRFMGLLRADVEALQRGAVEGDEVCEIVGLGPIPVRVARELLGDAVLKLVITKGVDVANVTHLGRSPTVAPQVALWRRSPDCTNLGCARSRRLENDHRDDWARTHQTRVDGLDPLCSHDHDLKTYFGWALMAGTGKRPLVPPDDPRHPKYRAPPGPSG